MLHNLIVISPHPKSSPFFTSNVHHLQSLFFSAANLSVGQQSLVPFVSGQIKSLFLHGFGVNLGAVQVIKLLVKLNISQGIPNLSSIAPSL